MTATTPEYMRQYRETNEAYRSQERRRQQAYDRALRAMAAAYPVAFRKIYNTERAALGLPPIGKTKPGPKPGCKKRAAV